MIFFLFIHEYEYVLLSNWDVYVIDKKTRELWQIEIYHIFGLDALKHHLFQSKQKEKKINK